MGRWREGGRLKFIDVTKLSSYRIKLRAGMYYFNSATYWEHFAHLISKNLLSLILRSVADRCYVSNKIHIVMLISNR